MGIPFKMKGSPMQRNFGIGSPAKTKGHGYDDIKHVHKVRPVTPKPKTTKKTKVKKVKKSDFPPIGVEVVI